MKDDSIMQIFDTLNNIKTELKFSDKVTIYLCGVTVYDDAHIGHARTISVFDVLRRFLESQKKVVLIYGRIIMQKRKLVLVMKKLIRYCIAWKKN